MSSLSPHLLRFLPELAVLLSLLGIFFRLIQSGEKRAAAGSAKPSPLMGVAAHLPWIAALASWILTRESASWYSFSTDVLTQGGKFFLAFLWMLILRTMPMEFKKPDSERQRLWNFFSACALLGMMLLLSARKATLFYVSLELAAYSSYALAALDRTHRQSEAVIKYFTLGAAMSVMGILGLALLYAQTGTTELSALLLAGDRGASGFDSITLAAVLLFWVPVLTKWTLFPFHFWAPDVYETAPLPSTAFLASVSKAAALMFTAFLWTDFVSNSPLRWIWLAAAALSMTLGNLAALHQTSPRRLLAYSSIAQAGYVALALISSAPEARAAVFFYAVMYACANLGAFYVLYRAEEDHHTTSEGHTQTQDALKGYGQTNPLLGLVFLVSLLSLAGVPPLAGFAGKWFLFGTAMKNGQTFLVLWAVLHSVLSLYYYLVLVKKVFGKDETPHQIEGHQTKKAATPPSSRIAADRWVTLFVVGTLLVSGILPGLLLNPLAGFFSTRL